MNVVYQWAVVWAQRSLAGHARALHFSWQAVWIPDWCTCFTRAGISDGRFCSGKIAPTTNSILTHSRQRWKLYFSLGAIGQDSWS